MNIPSFPRVLNVLIGLGILAFVAGLILPFWLYRDAPSLEGVPGSSVILEGTLGEEGASCGGVERLPCQPGLVCKGDTESTYGICMPDEREAVPPGSEGETCGGDRGCEAGLVCNAVGGAAGVCVPVEQMENQ